jgi:hypothetical protein
MQSNNITAWLFRVLDIVLAGTAATCQPGNISKSRCLSFNAPGVAQLQSCVGCALSYNLSMLLLLLLLLLLHLLAGKPADQQQPLREVRRGVQLCPCC